MARLHIAVTAALFASHAAFADPPGLTPLAEPYSAGVQPLPNAKDPDTALWLSIGGTAVSLGMVAVGAKINSGELAVGGVAASLLLPSAGEWYAGEYFTAGMGIRAGGAALAIAGLASSICFDQCNDQNESLGITMMVLGAVGYGAGIIYDIAHAPHAATKYNERHRQIVVTPTAFTVPTGTAPGLVLAGAF